MEGFEEDTLDPDIKRTLAELEDSVGVHGIERFGVGYRSNKGRIKFESNEMRNKFLQFTKDQQPIKTTCKGKKVELKIKIWRSKEDLEESKEIRRFAYHLRKNMVFEEYDKSVLDVDFRQNTVLVNKKRVAEFLDNGQKVKGMINKAKHVFTIDMKALKEETTKVGYSVDPEKVKQDYEDSMQE